MNFDNLFGEKRIFKKYDEGASLPQEGPSSGRKGGIFTRPFQLSLGVTTHSPFNIFARIFGKTLTVSYTKGEKRRVLYVNRDSLMDFLRRNRLIQNGNIRDFELQKWVESCLSDPIRTYDKGSVPQKWRDSFKAEKEMPTLAVHKVPAQKPEGLSLQGFHEKFNLNLPPGYSKEQVIPLGFNVQNRSDEWERFVEAVKKANPEASSLRFPLNASADDLVFLGQMNEWIQSKKDRKRS